MGLIDESTRDRRTPPRFSGEEATLLRKPLPEPSAILPAYESLEDMVRRVVRDELRPVLERLEEDHIRGNATSDPPVPGS
jgi:hypothetical protein